MRKYTIIFLSIVSHKKREAHFASPSKNYLIVKFSPLCSPIP